MLLKEKIAKQQRENRILRDKIIHAADRIESKTEAKHDLELINAAAFSMRKKAETMHSDLLMDLEQISDLESQKQHLLSLISEEKVNIKICSKQKKNETKLMQKITKNRDRLIEKSRLLDARIEVSLQRIRQQERVKEELLSRVDSVTI